jgi:hypothetical protein
MEIWTRQNGVTNPLALSRGRSHYRARVPDIGLVFCRPDGLYPARPSTPSWTKAGATGLSFRNRKKYILAGSSGRAEISPSAFAWLVPTGWTLSRPPVDAVLDEGRRDGLLFSNSNGF